MLGIMWMVRDPRDYVEGKVGRGLGWQEALVGRNSEIFIGIM